MTKPEAQEYAPFYAGYVDQVHSPNGIDGLVQSQTDLLRVLGNLPAHKGTYKYAEGKWSINELLQHLIDSEIIFANRALRIARGDKTPLPGFEQDDYVATCYADYQSLSDLVELFKITRQLTIALFKSFAPQYETNTANANGHDVSLRALCFIIAGHTIHHTRILEERYL